MPSEQFIVEDSSDEELESVTSSNKINWWIALISYSRFSPSKGGNRSRASRQSSALIRFEDY